MPKDVPVVYALQLLVVFLLALSLLISDPLQGTLKGTGTRKQWLVPSNVWLTRVVDPLKQTLKWSDTNNAGMPKFSRLDVADQKTEPKSTIHDFIQEHILTEKTDRGTFEDISKNPMSPLTRAMVVMGCYGNPQANHDMTSEAVQELTANASHSFLLNILLNSWEVRNIDLNQKQQNLMHVLSSIVTAGGVTEPKLDIANDHSACSCMKDFASPLLVAYDASNDKYKYDSCLAQNVVDYAKVKKDRTDPLMGELIAYFEKLQADIESRFNTAHPNRRLLGDNSTADHSLKNISIAHAKKNYKELETFLDAFGMHPPVGNLHALKEYLVEYIQKQTFAHNKLRTPIFSARAGNDLDFSQTPPLIPEESYKIYMHKYRSAYEVCAHAGVPNYETKQLAKLVPSRFAHLGMAFLLAASLFGFSIVYKRKMYEANVAYEPKISGSMAFIEFTVRLITLLAIVWMLIRVNRDLNNEDRIKENNGALTFVIVTWFVFWAVIVAEFAWDFWDWFYPDPAPTDGKNPYSINLVRQQIGQDVAIIAGLANLAVALRLQRGDGDENVVLGCFALFIVIGLLQHMSNLVRMMQQYTQENLRKTYKTELQEQAQADLASQMQNRTPAPADPDGHNSFRIAYNRVLITFIVAVGLVAYLTLASSTIQKWTPDVIYTEQHARLFAFCAFFIFSAYDMFFELLVAVNYEAADLEQQHPRKMMWTSWTIIVSLLFLHMHQFFALCYTREDMAAKEICELPAYFFRMTPEWD
jgi:hypothetical protein